MCMGQSLKKRFKVINTFTRCHEKKVISLKSENSSFFPKLQVGKTLSYSCGCKSSMCVVLSRPTETAMEKTEPLIKQVHSRTDQLAICLNMNDMVQGPTVIPEMF